VKFLSPGSFLWLLVHEVRVTFRGGVRSNWVGIAITTVFITVLTVFAGIPLAVALRHFTLPLTPMVVLSIDSAAIVVFTLLLSQTLSSATLALYERGDLDLLLSSPVSARRVLAVRALVIATSPLAIFLSLLGPMVIPSAFFGHAQWLGAIGVLASLALAASSVGLFLAMALFSLIGPRRTRTLGQLLAAFIGAALFLAGQGRYLFGQRAPQAMVLFRELAATGLFRRDTLFGSLAAAVVGEPIPFATVALSAVSLFVFASWALGTRFSRDASIAAGVSAGTSRVDRSRPARRFRAGVFRSLVRKELLLLARDPALLSQVFLRVLYLLPLVFILVRNTQAHLEGQVSTGTGALVFIASQVSASLSWITVSAEDAPDLLVSAPISRRFTRRAKLSAALLPLGMLLVIPIAYLSLLSPRIGLIAAIGVVVASISAGLINLWYEVPGQRRQFRRRGSGTLVGNIAVLLMGLGWSATTSGAAFGSPWTIFGVIATLAVLFGFYRGRTNRA
jgi:ABC-2 type transport system permease protein